MAVAGLAVRSSMDRVALFLGALASAGLEDRSAGRGDVVSDYSSAWAMLACLPASLRPMRRGCPSPQQIWREEAEAAGITLEAIKGKRRTARLVTARHEAWRRMVDERGMTLSGIGRLTGHNHTSVMHGVERARERRAGFDYER